MSTPRALGAICCSLPLHHRRPPPQPPPTYYAAAVTNTAGGFLALAVAGRIGGTLGDRERLRSLGSQSRSSSSSTQTAQRSLQKTCVRWCGPTALVRLMCSSAPTAQRQLQLNKLAPFETAVIRYRVALVLCDSGSPLIVCFLTAANRLYEIVHELLRSTAVSSFHVGASGM